MRYVGLCLVAVTAVLAQSASSPTRENRSPLLSIPPEPEGLRSEARLPLFEAKDIAGRTWRLEDLRGKLTLIYIWNTFEARAIDAHAGMRNIVSGLSDLPEVQRFYDKVRRSKNIQVLTFCNDYDYTHAAEYMKQNKYSFPVIADWVLIKKVFSTVGNPPYSVIDRDARLAHSPRSWSLGRVLYEIERDGVR